MDRHEKAAMRQQKAAVGQAKKAFATSASFEGVQLRNGTLTVMGKDYPVDLCSARVEQGADVRRRGWTLTTGMVGSEQLRGHMSLVIVTPDGTRTVVFRAAKVEKAERFVAQVRAAAEAVSVLAAL